MRRSFTMIILSLCLVASAAAQTTDADKEHISTLGFQLFLRDADSCQICDYSLFRVESESERDNLLAALVSAADTCDAMGRASLMIASFALGRHEFKEHRTWVFISAPTDSLTTSNPYRHAGSSEVVFELTPDTVSTVPYALVRTYRVKRAEDDFIDSDKFVLIGDQKIKLEPRKL